MTERYILIPRVAFEQKHERGLTINEIYLYSWLYMRRMDIKVNHEPFVETSIDMINNLSFTFSKGNESRNKSNIKNILTSLVGKRYINTSFKIKDIKHNDSIIVTFKDYETSFNILFSVFEGIETPKELYDYIATKYGFKTIKQNRSTESEYENWRITVLDNDNQTCKICGASAIDNPDVLLHAHHKDGYDWCIVRRTDPSNGVTLCDSCHTEFHVMYGYGGNTEQQYIEFCESKMLTT